MQCAACKRVGHVAKHCDMPAMAICLEQYMKHDLLVLVHDTIERDWLNHWKECLGNPNTTPHQVLWAYMEELDITVTRLDDAMEWERWARDAFDHDLDDADE
jgi:hypothetical protein